MRLVLSFAVILTLAAGVAVASVRPPAGTRFVGKTTQGKTIHLKVVKGGGLEMTFRSISTCSRGPKKISTSRFKRDKPHIRKNGTFDYRKTYRNMPPIPGFPEPFDDVQHLKGSFPDAQHVEGRFDETVTGRKTATKCSIHLKFLAGPVG
jgi:hypothetical protein